MNAILEEAAHQMMRGVNPIRRLRKSRGLRAIQLAEAAGVSEQTIWKIETGASSPRGSTLYKVASALNVKAPDLVHCYYEWESASKGGSPETLLRTVSADPDIYLRHLDRGIEDGEQ